jgi:hypothetical protein
MGNKCCRSGGAAKSNANGNVHFLDQDDHVQLGHGHGRQAGAAGPRTPPPVSSSAAGGVDYSALEANAQEENFAALRKDFAENPTLFLVNQLMLSVQFFKNFDR